MSQIRSRNTKPELIVRRFLHSAGFRYRLYVKNLPGKPDLVFPRFKTVIFIHGCFWHGHTHCKYYVIPKSRRDWWLNKISSNIANDTKSIEILKKNGWKVITVWECQLKKEKLLNTLQQLEAQIKR